MAVETEDQSLFLAGTHPANMDSKGRIGLPAAWRSILRHTCDAGDSSVLYIVNDFQYPALRFYSHREYLNLSRRILQLQNNRWKRLLNMLFFGNSQAVNIQFDDKSRSLVRINKERREHAHLQSGMEMSLVGEGQLLSLWRNEWLAMKIEDQAVPHMQQSHRIPQEILMECDLWEAREECSEADTSR